MSNALAVARLIAVVLVFGISLLSILKVPIGFLWKPAIVATEWGHLLAVVAVILALPGWSEARGQLETVLAIVAVLFLVSPLLRAIPVARAVPARLNAAFGESVEPRTLPDAPARSGPLVIRQLLSVSSPHVQPTRHAYREIRGVRLYLDLYRRQDATRPSPTVITIHGGSWTSGDSTQLPAINHYLAARGYAVAAINYRLAPRHVFPAARDDVLASIAFLEENAEEFGLDAGRLVLMGRSAGGHLALLVAYTAHNPAIRGVVAFYPGSDMNWRYANPTNRLVMDQRRTLEDFLGGTPEEAQDNYRTASPYVFVNADVPPTLLFHGTRDELVFARETRRLKERLADAKGAHLYIEMPWATHGFDANLAGPGGQISTYAIERFLAAVTGPRRRKGTMRP